MVGDEYNVVGEYEGAHSYIAIRHNICNHTYNVTPDAFLRGNRCPNCFESKGEQAIRKYLTNSNIKFVREHSFDALVGINGGLLRFDFYLLDYNLLIEYDGEFHFKKVYDNDGHETIKKHDNIKNTYCIKNNIDLVRIPYWDFDNIEQILNKVLFENDSAYFIA